MEARAGRCQRHPLFLLENVDIPAAELAAHVPRPPHAVLDLLDNDQQ